MLILQFQHPSMMNLQENYYYLFVKANNMYVWSWLGSYVTMIYSLEHEYEYVNRNSHCSQSSPSKVYFARVACAIDWTINRAPIIYHDVQLNPKYHIFDLEFFRQLFRPVWLSSHFEVISSTNSPGFDKNHLWLGPCQNRLTDRYSPTARKLEMHCCPNRKKSFY